MKNTARTAAIRESLARFHERRSAHQAAAPQRVEIQKPTGPLAEHIGARVFEYRLGDASPWLVLISTNADDTAKTLRRELAVRFGCPSVEVRERIRASQGSGR